MFPTLQCVKLISSTSKNPGSYGSSAILQSQGLVPLFKVCPPHPPTPDGPLPNQSDHDSTTLPSRPASGSHCVFITFKESLVCPAIRPHYSAPHVLTLVTLGNLAGPGEEFPCRWPSSSQLRAKRSPADYTTETRGDSPPLVAAVSDDLSTVSETNRNTSG